MRLPHTIYYSDELNDEFAGDSITPRKIDDGYNYGDDSFLFMAARFFWYRIIALPIAFLYMKIKYHHKIVNKGALKKAKKSPVFMYANHTNNIPDALIPTFVGLPRSVYVIVNANNVSMPILGKITPYLGALPLPDNLAATKNFMSTISLRIKKKNTAIMIYPEAHIWPFYTKIRPFSDLSFRYPILYNTAAFCFTNTYQKRAFSKTPRIVTYIDGPFYADASLGKKEAQKDLRNRIYEAMNKRSLLNNVEVIKYIKKTKEDGEKDD